MMEGPAGRLEALLEEPEDRLPVYAAVVCHPHPLFGGTLHNKVVYRIARGLRRSGHVVLRFNFRGVNLSEGVHDKGVGEVEDLRTALGVLRQRYPELPYTLAGFSFGSRVALRLAQDSPDARRALAVGFPALVPGTDDLVPCPVPRIFIHSRIDELCPPDAAERFFLSLPDQKQFYWVEGRDHFFGGALPQFEDLVYSLQ